MNRSIAPEFKQAESIKLIFPEKIELENGVELFWIKDVKDESVKLDIEWFAGSKYQRKKLVASFTNRLLLSGNSKRSAPWASLRGATHACGRWQRSYQLAGQF